MAGHTSLHIGGPADLFARTEALDELCAWVRLARREGVPVFILGHGTNILVADKGIRGLVIENGCEHYELRELNDQAVLYAEGGASLPGLALATAKEGWAGLEWAIGIPSSIAAAVVNNAGAHGGCIADVLRQVRVLTESGQIEAWPAEKLGLRYRSSRLKGHGSADIVLAAEFVLRRESPELLAERMARYSEQRRQSQPAESSAGSIFKNPPGEFAGRLIEQAGLKGARVGGAEVSPEHANFIVNTGGATASDVWKLIEIIRATVRKKFGVELELEIELVGEWIRNT
jgi:UDP-N-acetylmuramate dehydrogenase